MTDATEQAAEQIPDQVQLPEAETRLHRLLAFQPVFARNLDVKAFELLLEHPDNDDTLDDLQALNWLIVQSYSSIYQRGQLQTLPCILKVGETILLDDSLPELPRNQYILEVDGSQELSREACERLRDLASKGYLLVLGNYRSDLDNLEPLLRIVHTVRLDVGALGLQQLDAAVADLKPYGLDLFADNLPGPDAFRHCLDQGFTYFRGDFLGSPENVRGTLQGNNKMVLLQLLAELEQPLPNLEQLEEIIIRDSGLTYKFLKAANSATYGTSREIETLHQALAMLGLKQMRRWISLFLLETDDDKPLELTRRALVRARMCELIAELSNRQRPIGFFITGLLSELDVLTDIPMSDLMANVPLNQDIKTALLSRQGEMGNVLAEVEAYEQGQFDRLHTLGDRSFYEVGYRHSTAWAKQLLMSGNNG